MTIGDKAYRSRFAFAALREDTRMPAWPWVSERAKQREAARLVLLRP